MLNLSKNLGRTTAKPCVWKRRRSVDQLSRVALDHSAVNVLKNDARLPVVPREVTRGHTVEEIQRKLHVEFVVERVRVHDVNEPSSARQQIQISNEPQQPRGCVVLGHGDRDLNSGHHVHRGRQCSSESVSHGHRDRAVGRRVGGGAQDGQVVALTGLAGSDEELGRSEVLVVQQDPVTEKRRFIRVLCVRSHNAKVRTASGGRPADYFAVIVEDKIGPGDNVQGTGCRAKSGQVIRQPPKLNELSRDGTDQHPAVKDFGEGYGIATGRLGMPEAW